MYLIHASCACAAGPEHEPELGRILLCSYQTIDVDVWCFCQSVVCRVRELMTLRSGVVGERSTSRGSHLACTLPAFHTALESQEGTLALFRAMLPYRELRALLRCPQQSSVLRSKSPESAMDNDNEVLGQLGGFALGEVFKDLGIDTGDGINTVRGQLGLGKSSNAFSRDTIYGGKFVDAADDDDDDGSDQDKDDLEAEVDREMYDEKWQTKASSRAQPARGGGQQQTLMRGEEDDFDDDDDNEDAGGAGQARVGQHASQPGDTATVIKQEPGDDNMFGDVPFDQNSMANANLDRMSIDPVPPPQPRRPVDVKELFPSFDYGKTLDFTELFSTTYRPRKRQKTAAEGSKGKQSGPQVETSMTNAVSISVPIPFAREIPRSRSTRDALVAPLKPSTRSSALRDLLIQAQEREREEWEDEGSSDEELLKAIEVSDD